MYHRILVPIDGSATAQRGFDEALKLAQAFDASLVLLHVLEYQPMPMPMEVAYVTPWELIATSLRESGQRLLDSARGSAHTAGVACEARLEESVAARAGDVIADQASQRACDLIVMGTHGRRGIARALIGSDAECAVRQAPCPVLLVRAPKTA